MLNYRFLITGASGFLGSSLSLYLQQKYVVFPVTRGLRDDTFNYISLEYLLGDSGLDILRSIRPTHLIHCAAIVHRNHECNSAELRLINSVNVDLPVSLARLAINAGVRRFVFLSSLGVHGARSLPGIPISEESPLNPMNAYSRSKVAAEKALFRLLDGSSCELSILRPALVYGPGAKGNLKTLSTAIDWCFPFPTASISNLRSFVALPNLLSAIEHVSLHPRAAGQIYLVSDSELVSTSSLIKMIARVRSRPSLQFPVPIIALEKFSCIPFVGVKIQQLTGDLVVDSSKIRSQLAWSQPVAQADGLAHAFSC